MRTRVVLVNPPAAFAPTAGSDRDFPLNLALLGSCLIARGYEVEIHNALIHEDWQARTLRSLASPGVAYAGVTCMSSQVGPALEISKAIKAHFPRLPVVWGGVHPTLLPATLVATPWVDYCVTGEGDRVVDRLVHVANGAAAPHEVSNLVYRGPGGAIQATSPAPLTPFDDLPQEMAPELYERDLAAYLPGTSPVRQFSLLTGLGCRHRCAFCINPITGRRYRAKSAVAIYREMRHLAESYGVDFFVFQDEHFFAERRRLFDLLPLIEGDRQLLGKVRWTTTVRVSDIRDDYLSVDVMRRLARAGCVGLGTGGESGSNRVLGLLRKGITREQILRAARMANQAQLMLSFSFVMLWPGETLADMAETANTILELLSLGPYAHVPYFQTYRPYPGSAFEPDLSRFSDPETLPDEIWAFQSARPERFAGFEQPRRVFQLVRTTQALCDAAEGARVAVAPAERQRHHDALAACRRRILEKWPDAPAQAATC